MKKKKILFICTSNAVRSKTGEFMYRNVYETKSAGTNPDKTALGKSINEDDLNWADLVIVFENNHLAFLELKYPNIYHSKKIINLNIPNTYSFMSQDLVELIKRKMKNKEEWVCAPEMFTKYI